MIANSSLTSNRVDAASTLLQLPRKPLDLNENDAIRTYPDSVAANSTVIDMAHLSSQNEIANDRDSEHDSSDQGSKKKGTRGRRFSHAVQYILHYHLHSWNREGKEKRPERMSPNTPDPVYQSPTGEDEESQGVHAKGVPAMELPDATELEVHELHVESSDKPRNTTHPNNSGWQDRPGGQGSPHSYNTAQRSGLNHPTYNNFGPPMNSTTGYTSYGINGPYHQSSRPRQGYPTERLAHFSDNSQMSNETQTVGLRISGRTGTSDQDVLNATANWELERNFNYGLSDQVVGQMVLDGGRPKRHAGRFNGNQNINGGQQVVGLDC